MKSTSFRAKALACALLAGTACCGLAAAPASAQTSPTHRHLDSNGVDLVRGDFVTGFPEGSIGSGEAELALLRMVGAIGGSPWFSGNQWDNILLNVGSSATIVEFGSRSDSFPGAESRGSALLGSGDSRQYRSPDGTVIAFTDPKAGTSDLTNFCNNSGTQAGCVLVPTSIASPDGRTVTLEWEFWEHCVERQNFQDPTDCYYTPRLARVSNSFGYSIAFAYASPPGQAAGPPPSTFYRRTGAAFRNDSQTGGAILASVIYNYPSTGIVEVTDTGGRVWGVTSSPTYFAVRRPGAASDTTAASLIGGVVTSVTREGVATNYSRSVSGGTATMQVTQMVPGGTSPVSTIVSNLTSGRPTSVTDPLGHSTGFDYDSSGRLTRVTAHEGNYVEHSYDGRGNITRTVAVPKGGSGPTIVTSALFDSTCANPVTCNQPISTTDARGNVTEYEYDPTHGGVTRVKAPAPSPNAVQPETRYSYTFSNGEYRLTGISQCRTTSACSGTADEVKTALAYDSNGNLYWTATGDGTGTLVASTTTGFDPVGNPVSVDGPLPGTSDSSQIRYNDARQAVGSVSPDPDGAGPLRHRAVRNEYDGSTGLLVKVEQGNVDSQSEGDWAAFAPTLGVETIYDSNARPVVSKLVSGSTVHALSQTSYDALGRPDCSAQRMNPALFGATLPGACDQSLGTGVHGPDRISKSLYDPAGRIVEVKTALGTADAASEVTKDYTANGRVQWVKDGENNKTSYEYDGHDRPVKTYYPIPNPRGSGSSNGGDYEQQTYESLAGGTRTSPLVASFRNRAGDTIAFGHDSLGRLTSKDLPGSEPDVAYGYDLLGQLASATQPGHALAFTYDALGRNLNQTGPLGTVASEWDIAGRRTKLTWPDAFFVAYDHLVTGEVTRIRENGAASGIGVLATFAYDNLGRRTSLTLGNGVATIYAYDPVSRLEELKLDFAGTSSDLVSSFTYNPASQIASNTRSNDAYAWTSHGSGTTSTTANGLNQIGSWTSALGYDSKGNIVADGAYTYGYSSENLLTSLANPTPGAIQSSSTYAYDPLMRLAVINSSNDVLDASLGYDGQDFILEGLSNNRTRRYVRGPGVDEPLVAYLVTSAGTSRLWYQADERGSIARLTNDSGTPGGIGKYDEYGVGGTGRIRYAGQYWLADGNLLYSRARIYDARLGRFLQPDPIGYGGGMNLYAYVGGDPVNFTDPSGLAPKKPPVVCTGTRIASGCGAGGIARGLSGFTSAGPGGEVGGHYEYVKGTGPAGSSDNGDIVISGDRVWVIDPLPVGSIHLIAAPPRIRDPLNDGPLYHAPNTPPPAPRGPDYCGANGSSGVPDSIGGTDISGPCASHDACYASNSSQGDCDAELMYDIWTECDRQSRTVGCYAASVIYYQALRLMGRPAYNAAQRGRRR